MSSTDPFTILKVAEFAEKARGRKSVHSILIIMSDKLQRYVHEALIFMPSSEPKKGAVVESDQTVDVSEFQSILDYLGVKMTAPELKQWKEGFLSDYSNGKVPLETLELSIVTILSGYNQDAMLEAFKMLGGDKTGKISKTEFKHYLENFGAPMSKEDMDLLLDLAPCDKEGNIDC